MADEMIKAYFLQHEFEIKRKDIEIIKQEKAAEELSQFLEECLKIVEEEDEGES